MERAWKRKTRNLLGLDDVLVKRVCSTFLVLVVFDVGGGSLDMLGSFFSVEECRGFLERSVFGLDDEEVQEDKLESKPAAVYDLYVTMRRGRR